MLRQVLLSHGGSRHHHARPENQLIRERPQKRQRLVTCRLRPHQDVGAGEVVHVQAG